MPQKTSPEIKKLVTEISRELKALPELKADPIRRVRREFSKRLADRPPRGVRLKIDVDPLQVA